jgi:hypothetical protein
MPKAAILRNAAVDRLPIDRERAVPISVLCEVGRPRGRVNRHDYKE